VIYVAFGKGFNSTPPEPEMREAMFSGHPLCSISDQEYTRKSIRPVTADVWKEFYARVRSTSPTIYPEGMTFESMLYQGVMTYFENIKVMETVLFPWVFYKDSKYKPYHDMKSKPPLTFRMYWEMLRSRFPEARKFHIWCTWGELICKGIPLFARQTPILDPRFGQPQRCFTCLAAHSLSFCKRCGWATYCCEDHAADDWNRHYQLDCVKEQLL